MERGIDTLSEWDAPGGILADELANGLRKFGGAVVGTCGGTRDEKERPRDALVTKEGKSNDISAPLEADVDGA
jgi:hypothetical protein